MSDGVGDDFFDAPVMSSQGSRGGGGGRGGGRGGRGGGGKNRRRTKKNNSFHKDNNGHMQPNGHANNGGNNYNRNRSKSPKNNNNNKKKNNRGKSRSNSPRRHYNANSNDLHHHYNPKKDGPPDITVVVNRVDLYDSAAHIHAVAVDGPSQPKPPYPVTTYAFENNRQLTSFNQRKFADCLVAIQRVPYSVKYVPCEDLQAEHQTVPLPSSGRAHSPVPGGHPESHLEPTPETVSVVDNVTPNPYDKSIDKYWAQRRRLFAKFDQGIQLDEQGWYSVTPEIIADHVAHRVGNLALKNNVAATNNGAGWVVLDAFCGCGGNGIAFSKVPYDRISLTVCVDTDRNKLRMAAHNASLYNIPPDQIVFVECNSIFIVQHCYRNGEFILDNPELMMEAGASAPIRLPSPVPTEVYEGYHIGGINMLPRRIDVVFMDPPWGGVDYEVLGKNGYDLEKNMKIRCQVCLEPDEKDTIKDDFFDSFCASPASAPKMGRAKKKANFNNDIVDEYVNGADMLRFAAAASQTKLVLYDLPRNTNKTSLGQSALAAGYRGNLKLEEHFLNGRLKTVTAYFGTDFSDLLNEPNRHSIHQQLTADGVSPPPGLLPQAEILQLEEGMSDSEKV